MLYTSAVLGLQLALLHSVQAQDDDEPNPIVITNRITLWEKEGCANNVGDGSTKTLDLTVYKDWPEEDEDGNTVEPEDQDLTCRVTSTGDLNGWETVDNGEWYETYVDQSTIEDGCKLLLFKASNDLDGKTRNCVTDYQAFGSEGRCQRLELPPKFGYSYCCGEKCGKDNVDDLFKNNKRDVSDDHKTVDDLFTHHDNKEKTRRSAGGLKTVDDLFSHRSKRNSKDQPRDVTLPKRKAPLDRLNKRDECSFEGDKEPTDRYYGEQVVVSPTLTCSSPDGCDLTWEMSYQEMIGESFGVGAEMGLALFEIFTASMSFDYTYEESETDTRSFTVTESVKQGFEGYIVWEPLLSCAEGKLTGDCDDEFETDNEDEACFVKMQGGNPGGRYGTVQETP